MPINSNIVDNIYNDIGLQAQSTPNNDIKKELGQADFLALLTAQLANQDPLSPLDNTEFISQMSQFASVDSLQTLVTQFDQLSTSLTSNQALQASALVGRNVLIPTGFAYLADEQGVSGQVNLTHTTRDIWFEIKDEAGAVVRRVEVGNRDAGDVNFVWDGRSDGGDLMPLGRYQISAYGQVGSKTEQLQTSMRARVQSVNLGGANGGVILNLYGLGEINFNEVKEIG